MIFHPGSSRGNFNRVPPGEGFSHAHTSLLDSTDLLFSVIAFDIQLFSYYLQKVTVVKCRCAGQRPESFNLKDFLKAGMLSIHSAIFGW